MPGPPACPYQGRAEVKRKMEWASCLANACPGLSLHEGDLHIAGVTRGGWKKRKFATLGPRSAARENPARYGVAGHFGLAVLE